VSGAGSAAGERRPRGRSAGGSLVIHNLRFGSGSGAIGAHAMGVVKQESCSALSRESAHHMHAIGDSAHVVVQFVYKLMRPLLRSPDKAVACNLQRLSRYP
jgi:hypothetical protein